MASKYGNKKVKFNGETFDSKLELDYYRYLLNQKELGEIIDIQMKPVFVLQPGFTYHCKSIRKITYTADFMFEDKHGKIHIVDVKGMKTNEFKLKAKMFKYSLKDAKNTEMYCVKLHKERWIKH